MTKIARNVIAFIALIAVTFGIYSMVNNNANTIAEAAEEIANAPENNEVVYEPAMEPNTNWGCWW